VLLTPVFVVISFMAFQAAMWSHARTEARAGARDAVVLVARFGADPDDVEVSVAGALEATSVLADVEVSITPAERVRATGVVEVTIRARAHGILLGTATDVSITEVLPFEEFRE
jgi:hypothetical protein